MSRDGFFARHLPRLWYLKRLAPALWPLLPLAWLFRMIVAARRGLYRLHLIQPIRLPVPVVVVGNLTVGGSGKTPLVLWLVDRLQEQGWHPGVISRGYGGKSEEHALRVTAQSAVVEVGDEPLLLAKRSGVPVFVGRDRVAAGRALLSACPECDVVISDDGLQHYRLARAAEIVVFDARGVGNGRLLPAGPLREPLARRAEASAEVWNGGVPERHANAQVPPQFAMRLTGQRFVRLGDEQRTCPAQALTGKNLHAVAGIGNPARFFAQLAALGLEFAAHAFPDHYAYQAADLAFAPDAVLLMTEKDAVKCAGLALPEAWVLPVDAHLDDAPDGRSLLDTILEKLHGCPPA